jgi:hypothetical protein
VLKKLQEVDKLKRILLNPKQLAIFDFVPPPVIRINIDRRTSFKSQGAAAPNSFSEYLKYFIYYSQLQGTDDPVTQHLLRNLDHDTLSVFRKIQELLDHGGVRIQEKNGLYFIAEKPRKSMLQHTEGEEVIIVDESPANIKKSGEESDPDEPVEYSPTHGIVWRHERKSNTLRKKAERESKDLTKKDLESDLEIRGFPGGSKKISDEMLDQVLITSPAVNEESPTHRLVSDKADKLSPDHAINATQDVRFQPVVYNPMDTPDSQFLHDANTKRTDWDDSIKKV